MGLGLDHMSLVAQVRTKVWTLSPGLLLDSSLPLSHMEVCTAQLPLYTECLGQEGAG